MVSRYAKQRTGKGKTVGRSMQTEGNFGGEQGFAHKTAQSAFNVSLS